MKLGKNGPEEIVASKERFQFVTQQCNSNSPCPSSQLINIPIVLSESYLVIEIVISK